MAGECGHYWIGSNGLCIECGNPPASRHEHRFVGVKFGQTQLTCEDCKMVVFITPEEAGKQIVIASEMSIGIPLPHMFAKEGILEPNYIGIVRRYNRWMVGSDG